MARDTIAYRFFGLSLVCLLTGMFFGILGGIQYILPEFIKAWLPFTSVRPLHTLFVISWILLCATGTVYFVLPRIIQGELKTQKLTAIHFLLFAISGLCAAVMYFSGAFGGREYQEFLPWLAIPILAGWILLAVSWFVHIFSMKNPWPVYVWMWSTGILFFIFTFSESMLWVFPWFRENVIRDTVIQWKANGALVGSWNMLVYGTGVFVMSKIQPDSKALRGTLAYAVYFTGFTNLLFGWAHHIYIVPSAPWIRHISYFISMTEWVLLVRMILKWKSTLMPEVKHRHRLPYMFLFSSNYWVALNLLLALLISIPALNLYTHGTHITVAHAMGTTIGINTPILLSLLFLLLEKEISSMGNQKRIKAMFYVFNLSLVLFFCSLIAAGVIRSWFMYGNPGYANFHEMHLASGPVFLLMLLSGCGIFISLGVIALPLLRAIQFRLRVGTPPEI